MSLMPVCKYGDGQDVVLLAPSDMPVKAAWEFVIEEEIRDEIDEHDESKLTYYIETFYQYDRLHGGAFESFIQRAAICKDLAWRIIQLQVEAFRMLSYFPPNNAIVVDDTVLQTLNQMISNFEIWAYLHAAELLPKEKEMLATLLPIAYSHLHRLDQSMVVHGLKHNWFAQFSLIMKTFLGPRNIVFSLQDHERNKMPRMAFDWLAPSREIEINLDWDCYSADGSLRARYLRKCAEMHVCPHTGDAVEPEEQFTSSSEESADGYSSSDEEEVDEDLDHEDDDAAAYYSDEEYRWVRQKRSGKRGGVQVRRQREMMREPWWTEREHGRDGSARAWETYIGVRDGRGGI